MPSSPFPSSFSSSVPRLRPVSAVLPHSLTVAWITAGATCANTELCCDDRSEKGSCENKCYSTHPVVERKPHNDVSSFGWSGSSVCAAMVNSNVPRVSENVCFCLPGDLWCAPLVSEPEESALLLGIALSGALIACRFQTIHQGCNYVEEVKTASCHSGGATASPHTRCWHPVVEMGPGCSKCSVHLSGTLLTDQYLFHL